MQHLARQALEENPAADAPPPARPPAADARLPDPVAAVRGAEPADEDQQLQARFAGEAGLTARELYDYDRAPRQGGHFIVQNDQNRRDFIEQATRYFANPANWEHIKNGNAEHVYIGAIALSTRSPYAADLPHIRDFLNRIIDRHRIELHPSPRDEEVPPPAHGGERLLMAVEGSS
ncbi:MAG: hypothetical protein LBT58_01765 [Endomicrobium sp.]|nr:hypothetical protein [Endomicrobium sp.]